MVRWTTHARKAAAAATPIKEAAVEKQKPARKKRRGLRLFRSSPDTRDSPATATTSTPLFGRRRRNNDTSGKEPLQTVNSAESDPTAEENELLFRRTHVLTLREPAEEPEDEEVVAITEDEMVMPPTTSACCSPGFLPPLERLCGPSPVMENVEPYRHLLLPDDPTVQESIECVFGGAQEGLSLLDDCPEEEEEERDLVAPSALQQSLVKSRSKLNHVSPVLRKRHSKLSTTTTHMDETMPTQSCKSCRCAHQTRPLLDPSQWPQAPLFLRPTPGSGTRIRGIRLAAASDYLWTPTSTVSWPVALQAHWGRTVADSTMTGMCHECMVLPINNGNETEGQALVTDFESDLFEGTLLLRLRHSEGTTPKPYNDDEGYFAGMNRRYQCVVSGRFKCVLPLTECVTGLQLDRKVGKLPSKWIVKGAIKVIGFFAPQMKVVLDGDRPATLSPLGSTPQCIRVTDDAVNALDGGLEEPTVASQTVVGKASTAGSSMQRARSRKKAFDKLFVQQSPFPATDPNKVYTFEFLQHLFNFQDFTIELGSMLGSIDLKELLNGQPMQLMAAWKDSRLWSFDVWHESLYNDAEAHDGTS